MKRFISKIDYDLHLLLNVDKEKANELWAKIKNKKHFLEQAKDSTKDREGNKYLFGPSICHMILSNPQDVDAKFYESFVIEVLKDKYLSRLMVAENLSFASLILLRGSKDLSVIASKLLCNEISKKASINSYRVRFVNYDNMPNEERKIDSKYRDDSLEVKLTSNEVQTYLNRNHILITEDINCEEIDELMRFAMIDGSMDLRFKKVIFDLYQDSLEFRKFNDVEYINNETTPKL